MWESKCWYHNFISIKLKSDKSGNNEEKLQKKTPALKHIKFLLKYSLTQAHPCDTHHSFTINVYGNTSSLCKNVSPVDFIFCTSFCSWFCEEVDERAHNQALTSLRALKCSSLVLCIAGVVPWVGCKEVSLLPCLLGHKANCLPVLDRGHHATPKFTLLSQAYSPKMPKATWHSKSLLLCFIFWTQKRTQSKTEMSKNKVQMWIGKWWWFSSFLLISLINN